ncbi:MAG: hypothetical protein R3282_08845, partial [Rhodothermales bacterium]|nr:hypothetical protein [Rhodothermales bacterium]
MNSAARPSGKQHVFCPIVLSASFQLWPDGTVRYFPPFSVNTRLDPAKPHRLEVVERVRYVCDPCGRLETRSPAMAHV